MQKFSRIRHLLQKTWRQVAFQRANTTREMKAANSATHSDSRELLESQRPSGKAVDESLLFVHNTVLVLKEYPFDLFAQFEAVPNRLEILVDEFCCARIPVLLRRARCLVEPGRALSCPLHCTLLCGVFAMPPALCTFFS